MTSFFEPKGECRSKVGPRGKFMTGTPRTTITAGHYQLQRRNGAQRLKFISESGITLGRGGVTELAETRVLELSRGEADSETKKRVRFRSEISDQRRLKRAGPLCRFGGGFGEAKRLHSKARERGRGARTQKVR